MATLIPIQGSQKHVSKKCYRNKRLKRQGQRSSIGMMLCLVPPFSAKSETIPLQCCNIAYLAKGPSKLYRPDCSFKEVVDLSHACRCWTSSLARTSTNQTCFCLGDSGLGEYESVSLGWTGRGRPYYSLIASQGMSHLDVANGSITKEMKATLAHLSVNYTHNKTIGK